MESQIAMTEAETILASRDDSNHVSVRQLQSRAEALNCKLETILEVGLPHGDPVVSATKKLVETLGEMHINVRQQDSVNRDVYQYFTRCMFGTPTHIHN